MSCQNLQRCSVHIWKLWMFTLNDNVQVSWIIIQNTRVNITVITHKNIVQMGYFKIFGLFVSLKCSNCTCRTSFFITSQASVANSETSILTRVWNSHTPACQIWVVQFTLKDKDGWSPMKQIRCRFFSTCSHKSSIFKTFVQ